MTRVHSLKMMRILFWCCCLLAGHISVFAQPTDGLIAYYSFDACDATEDTGLGGNGIIIGNAACGCGVSGNGLEFDGTTSVQILSNLDILFGNDFTISFFVLPDPQGTQVMDIMSKSEVCGIDSTLELKYNPNTRAMTFTLSQQSNLSVRSAYNLPADRCYHHIAYVRRDRELLMYYDGIQQTLDPSSTIVRIINNGILTLGAGPCLANGEVQFRGTLDELRFYNRALTSFEVQDLYIPVDKITSPDTVLFTGTSMQVRLPVTCAPSVQWTPSTGVSNAAIAQPTITPPATSTYDVHLDYGFCQAFDSINITVADSSDLSCDKIFFPSGFTPNADNINDVWGISNVVFLGDFISLEVFDRWGGTVFTTTDMSNDWDGTKNGEEMMPGMYAYLFSYRCNGEEKQKAGSVVIIR